MSIKKILTVLGIPLAQIPGFPREKTTKVVVMFHLINSPMFIVGRIKKVSYEDWISENLQDQSIEIEVESSEGNGVLCKESADASWVWNNKATPNKDESIKGSSLIFLCVDPPC